MEKSKLQGLHGPWLITATGVVVQLVASVIQGKEGFWLFAQLAPLVGMLLYLALTLGKTDDRLNEFMSKTEKTLADFAQRTHGTLDAFTGQTNLKLDELVLSRPPGTLRVTKTPLEDMKRKLLAAKQHIYLMYFAEDPDLGTPTLDYWRTTAQAYLAGAKDHPIKIRRIATIAKAAKLRVLLENNEIYLKAGPALGRVNYRLMYLPHHELTPTQVDVIDDEAFLFSPYSANAFITNDKAMVTQYAAQFEKHEGHLAKDCTLLSTNGKRPPEGRLECCYSEDEMMCIARVMADLPNLGAIDDFRSLLERYLPSPWTWQKFANEYKASKHRVGARSAV